MMGFFFLGKRLFPWLLIILSPDQQLSDIRQATIVA
jgi:hypothetical protein